MLNRKGARASLQKPSTELRSGGVLGGGELVGPENGYSRTVGLCERECSAALP